MENTFQVLKNGKVAVAVWANPNTKEIYPANKNSFGYNALAVTGDEFFFKYGKDLKTNQGKADYRKFYYSAKSMQDCGFILVVRGAQPLWK